MRETKRQKRIRELINALSAMGRHGWHHYTFRDWQPLEAELRQLQGLDLPNHSCSSTTSTLP